MKYFYVVLNVIALVIGLKRSVDKNHYLITDCMNVEFTGFRLYLFVGSYSEGNRI